MTKLFSIRPGISLKGRKFKGVRGWAGKPTHPPLTDFPIVCYVLAGAFDALSFAGYVKDGHAGSTVRDLFVAGTYVIVAGYIVSLGAMLTGFWDWWKGIERDRSKGRLGKAKHTQVWRTMNWHMTLMLTTNALVIVDILIRLRRYDVGYAELPIALLSVVAATLVSWGSTYGGSLVFDYQFNVESLEGSTVWDETEVDQLPADKDQSEW